MRAPPVVLVAIEAAAGVSQFVVDCHYSGRTDSFGNAYRYQSRLRMDGSWRPVYDIWFMTR